MPSPLHLVEGMIKNKQIAANLPAWRPFWRLGSPEDISTMAAFLLFSEALDYCSELWCGWRPVSVAFFIAQKSFIEGVGFTGINS